VVSILKPFQPCHLVAYDLGQVTSQDLLQLLKGRDKINSIPTCGEDSMKWLCNELSAVPGTQ
jgi:hypothetical protein